MRDKIGRVLFFLAMIMVVMVGAGCGSKGDLYLPQDPQSSEQAS